LIDALKNCAEKLIKNKPYDFEYLARINNIKVAKDIQDTSLEGIDGVLGGWGLPNEVNDFIKYIAFTESAQYQTFEFDLKVDDVNFKEFVATGKNTGNGRAVIGFVRVEINGKAILPQYDY
jgi:hypothetical protein